MMQPNHRGRTVMQLIHRGRADLTEAPEWPMFFDMGVKGFDGSGCGGNRVPRSPITSLNHWEQFICRRTFVCNGCLR